MIRFWTIVKIIKSWVERREVNRINCEIDRYVQKNGRELSDDLEREITKWLSRRAGM
jgi:hypothetical protein